MSNELKNAYEFIKGKLSNFTPKIAIVLGSGLGSLTEEMENTIVIKYKDIPGFPVSNVEGHAAELVAGTIYGVPILAMKGRFHIYEGYDVKDVTMPIRIFSLLNIKTVILVNAAGAINKDYKSGDFMVINDHINFSGISALKGKNMDEFGTRFPDTTNLYDKDLRKILKKIIKSHTNRECEGVYAYMQGPSYETPAEIKALRLLGADAVGMSTVPEAIVARHCGMKVVAVSCIANMAAGILPQPLTHEEVLETGNRVKNTFKCVIKEFIAEIPKD